MKFKTPAAALAGFLAGALAIPSVVGAQSDDDPTPDEQTEASVEAVAASGTWLLGEVGEVDPDSPYSDADGFELPTELIDEINTETDKIIGTLREAGFNVGVTA